VSLTVSVCLPIGVSVCVCLSVALVRLSNALKRKTDFTPGEWGAFGIKDLRSDDVVMAGDSFYRPYRPPQEQRKHARALWQRMQEALDADGEDKVVRFLVAHLEALLRQLQAPVPSLPRELSEEGKGGAGEGGGEEWMEREWAARVREEEASVVREALVVLRQLLQLPQRETAT
jgi:hypothetical protein